MNKFLIFIILMIGFIKANAQNPVIINQPYDFQKWVNVKDALQFPTGCGVPVGTGALKGGNKKKAAIYRDSCGKKTYVYEPSDSTWAEVGGSGVTNLDTSRTSTSVTISSSTGNSATILQADTTKSGVLSAADKKNINRIKIVNSYAELRGITNPNTTVIYRYVQNNITSDFLWDATSTAVDDSVMIIKAASVTTGRFLRYYEDYILANWWPIRGDGFTDDSYYWQKAINFTVANGKTAKLRCLAGVYVVKNLLIYKDTDGNGQYDFVTMSISGPTPTHDVNLSIGAIAVFKVVDGSAFGLGVQMGRNVKIENISFTGPMTTPPSMKQVIEWQTSDWLTGGIRNNRYSPNAGFVVDPVNAAVSAPNRYPGVPYTQISSSGTSECLLNGCSFRNFNVAIMVSPNGVTQNCDNITFQNGDQFSNRIFWGSGQNQSRGNFINNLYSFGGTEYLINCNDYGLNQGTPPNLSNSNIAGGLKYIYAYNGGFSGINIVKTYFEGIWSLGLSADLPVTFEGTQITFARPDVFDVFTAPVVAQGRQLNFLGGSLEWFDNWGAAGIQFNCNLVNFKGTFLRSAVPTNGTEKDGVIHFDGVQLINNGNPGLLWESQHEWDVNPANINNVPIIPGMVYKTLNGVDATGKFTITSVDNKTEYIAIESKTIDIDTTTRTGKMITTNSELYQVGECLYSRDITIDYSNDIYGGTIAPIGWVTNIVADSVYIGYIPYGLSESTTYNISIVRIPRSIGRTLGDVTSGSATIANIRNGGTTFAVGSRIKGTGIPVGAYVTNVSGSNITISKAATASNNDVELYDAKLKYTISASSPFGISGHVLFKGDEILYNGTDTTKYIEVCTKAGVIAGSPAPQSRSVPFGGITFAGGTVKNKQVAYGSVVDTIKSEAAFQYNDTTNILTVDRARVGDGSEASPSVSFQNYTGSGLSHDVDGLKINEGGSKAFDIRTSDIFVSRNLLSLTGGNIGGFSTPWGQIFCTFLRPQPGSAATPSHNFDDGLGNLTNTGLFGSTSILGFSINGTEKMRLKTTTLNIPTLASGGTAPTTSGATKNVIVDANGDLSFSTIKVYTALLSQSGTSDPTAIVLGTNSIGTIVWTRNSTGDYTGTLSGAFTANKTWVVAQKGDMNGSNVNGLLYSTSTNAVSLKVTDNVGTSTDSFTNMSIEIRVYP